MENSTQNPSTTSTAAVIAQAAPVSLPTSTAAVHPPAVNVSEVATAAAKAALNAKASSDADEAASAARQALAVERQSEIARLTASQQEQAAEVERWRGAAKRQAALNALPGMKQPDTFLTLVMPHVDVNELGQLTDESRTALQSWRAEHAYLFESAAPAALGTTPAAAAGHRPAAGEFSPEDAEMMRMIGVKNPGKNRERLNPLFWQHNSIGKGIR